MEQQGPRAPTGGRAAGGHARADLGPRESRVSRFNPTDNSGGSASGRTVLRAGGGGVVAPREALNRRLVQAPANSGPSAGRAQPNSGRAGLAGRPDRRRSHEAGQSSSGRPAAREDAAQQVGNEDTQEDDATASVEESGRELLARMRELAQLQQQLEGLQQATASLQAAVTTVDRPEESQRTRSGLGGLLRRLMPAADDDAQDDDEDDDDDDEANVHPHVTCDGCGSGPPLVGQVFKCADCEDFDLCAECYRTEDRAGHPPDHRFRRREAASGERSMASPQLLLRILESTMLSEALRRSTEVEASEEEKRHAAEARAAEILSNLPRVCWDPAMQASECQGGECSLCLEDYKKGEEVLKLHCGHLFHEECIGPWFVKSLTCPLCQKEVS